MNGYDFDDVVICTQNCSKTQRKNFINMLLCKNQWSSLEEREREREREREILREVKDFLK